MKKILFYLFVCTSLSLNSQTYYDTLTSHFSGLSLIPATGGGYLSGNNGYGDITKMQLFDATYGVYGAGSIKNVLIAIPVKYRTSAFPPSIEVSIRQNNNGVPGSVIGASYTVPLSSIDTNETSFTVEEDFLYNVNVGINLISVPLNGSFWVAIDLPTAVGDSVALYTSDDTFTDAITHTGEIWSNGTFHTFGDPNNWATNVSLAIFPVIAFYDPPANTTYSISCSSLPSDRGTTTGAGSYLHNESVTVTATPNSCSNFVNWTVAGNVVSSNSSYTFTATANRNLVANFTSDLYHNVTLNSSPSQGGNTSGSGQKENNASVTVSASPDSGYEFVNWTIAGNVVSTDEIYTFTIGCDVSIVANFALLLAVPEYLKTGFSIFPNPVLDIFNFSSKEIISTLEIMTLDGKLISSISFNSKSGSIDVSELKSGIYFYSIISSNGTKHNANFVKQ